MQAVIALHDEDAADDRPAHELGGRRQRLVGIQGLRSGAHNVADVVMHWKSFVVPWAYRTNVALARREENMNTLHPPPIVRISGAFTDVRFTPLRADDAFRGGRRDFEQYRGTAHTLSNRFANNSTASCA